MSKKEKIIGSLELLKESWLVYKKNLWKFIEVILYGLVGLIPFFVVIMLIVAYGQSGLSTRVSLGVNILLGLLAFLAFVASICLAVVYSIRAKVASILLLKNDFTSAKENFKEAKPYFVRFLGVSLLLMVLVIAWGFVFIIPALIFGIYYGFAQYVLVVEGKRPFSSVERSYDLVKGYFWAVFGRFMLVIAIGIAVYLLISWPLKYLAETSAWFFSYNVFMNLIWVLLSPYFIIYPYQLYISLKKTNK